MAAKSMQVNLYGVQLNNKNLLSEETLDQQIVMMLEILADYNNRFDVMNKAIVENKDEFNRKIADTNEKVNKMQGQIKRTVEEVAAVRKEVEGIDQSLRRLDNRVTQMKHETDDKINTLNEGLREVVARVDDHAPRLEAVEALAAKTD
eukprot:CAMPEP_0173467892 /NCGR_PEP_ID=MMETSP1357-20121228/75886_1 /TAXON_ID=77926 /ORGANISM="Hemiselmis rufescens, Strain PCC563" /LENGTH=147 /DNA_ID=CAMNT_0014436063 /DNA_START=44 /DNA_END=484 /DNA_ORIENTATION=+